MRRREQLAGRRTGSRPSPRRPPPRRGGVPDAPRAASLAAPRAFPGANAARLLARLAKAPLAVALVAAKVGAAKVAPWTAVLAARALAPERAFRACSALALACNLARADRARARRRAKASSSSAAAAAILPRPPSLLLHPAARAFATPVTFVHASPLALRVVAPGALRSLRFYGRLTPVIVGYVKCLLVDSRRPGVREDEARSRELWDARHEWGARKTRDMLNELGGFYLKVGQVFATKSDLLPPQYVAALRNSLDDCPRGDGDLDTPEKVRAEVEGQLAIASRRVSNGGDESKHSYRRLEDAFATFDFTPLATATIAQVHVATTREHTAVGPPGTKVAVKLVRPGAQKLMATDMRAMLAASELADAAGLKLPFDHTRILREYRAQVPLEFDFEREARMLETLGRACEEATEARVAAPAIARGLCAPKMLAMRFVEGEPLGTLINRAVAAAGASSAPGFSERAAEGIATSAGNRVDGRAIVASLVEAYGAMIFRLGKFHSDPHPGNILVRPDGRTVSLIDFGQTKELEDATRLDFARLVLALAHDREEEALAIARDRLGLEIAGEVSSRFALVVLYVLFDTRMDIEEAHLSPLDADIPPEMRAVKIETIPEETFMLVRVVALIRGMLISLDEDVHARTVWAPHARDALERAGEDVPEWAKVDVPEATKEDEEAEDGGAHPAGRARAPQGTYARMKALAMFMRDRNLPHDRKAMMPFAAAGLTTLDAIVAEADAVDRADDPRRSSTTLDAAFRKFDAAQRARALDAAREEVRRAEEKNASGEDEGRRRRGEAADKGGRGGDEAFEGEGGGALTMAVVARAARWANRARRAVKAARAGGAGA